MSAKDKKSRTSHRELFVVSKDAPFQFVEAYKSLRTNLEFLSATSNCKTILITSSVPEEGKSNVAINLAITLAASNKRVVLVDCDMRKSAISRYLRIPRNHAGLTSVITARDVSKLPDALLRLKDSGITVLPVGAIPPNPAELLGSRRFEAFLDGARQAYDYVIIDAPPLGSVIDAAIIAKNSDASVMVISAKTISYKFARVVKDQLEKADCPILGVVLNKVDMKQNKYYGKYYGNYYGSYGENGKK